MFYIHNDWLALRLLKCRAHCGINVGSAKKGIAIVLSTVEQVHCETVMHMSVGRNFSTEGVKWENFYQGGKNTTLRPFCRCLIAILLWLALSRGGGQVPVLLQLRMPMVMHICDLCSNLEYMSYVNSMTAYCCQNHNSSFMLTLMRKYALFHMIVMCYQFGTATHFI